MKSKVQPVALVRYIKRGDKDKGEIVEKIGVLVGVKLFDPVTGEPAGFGVGYSKRHWLDNKGKGLDKIFSKKVAEGRARKSALRRGMKIYLSEVPDTIFDEFMDFRNKCERHFNNEDPKPKPKKKAKKK